MRTSMSIAYFSLLALIGIST